MNQRDSKQHKKANFRVFNSKNSKKLQKDSEKSQKDSEKSRYCEKGVPPMPAMPVAELVGGINVLLMELEKQGVKIADYDNKRRELYKVMYMRGKYYFFAAEPEDDPK
jgi:hypothetical protein